MSPDPRTVPPGEVWAVEIDDRSGVHVGVRTCDEPDRPWRAIAMEGYDGGWYADSRVTLLHRLVPARPVARGCKCPHQDYDLPWWIRPDCPVHGDKPDCDLCHDHVRPGHLCPECGLYDPNEEDDHAPQ